jgi:UMF1 family MFS transporter
MIRRKEVLAWTCYDWANSAYSTLSITVLVAYLQRVVFPEHEWGTTGAVVWAWGIASSMLCGAFLSPLIGAIADAHQSKRKWLSLAALTGATAAILLGLMPESWYVAIVIAFFTTNLMLEMSLTVYDGFLPQIATEDEMNRVSSWGYGLGYVGGGTALAVAMLIIEYGERMGLPNMADRLRLALVLMGAWWALFSLPTLLVLRDSARTASARIIPRAGSVRLAATEIATTLQRVRSFSALSWFLLSFLFYNDGVQTVISQSSTFALRELHFEETELIGLILMIQFLALPGALLVGWCADIAGRKRTVIACLLIWMLTLVLALFVNSKSQFWLLGALIALVMGGTQAVSRSLMGVMTPPRHAAQFFGFYNLSGKATGFIGSFSFGAIVALTGSPRWAIFGLVPFFAIGACLIALVDVKEGMRQKLA